MNNKSQRKKKAAKEAQGTHENQEHNEDYKEVKKRGALGNLYLKGLGSVGLVENTQLEKAFVESIGQHEEYRSHIDRMFNAVELILQPNVSVVNDGKLNEDAIVVNGNHPYHHPLNRVASRIKKLAELITVPAGKPDCLGKTERHILETLPHRCNDLAEIEKKSRTHTRTLMNRTRFFLTKELDEFKENRREVDRNMLVMDDMRNQVKKAKTKAELEKAGKGYTAAVQEFNRRADLIDRCLEGHAESVYFHQRDLSRMFGERHKFHLEMSRKLQEWDNEVCVVEHAEAKKK